MRTPQCLSLCAGSITRSVDLKRHENFRVLFMVLGRLVFPSIESQSRYLTSEPKLSHARRFSSKLSITTTSNCKRQTNSRAEGSATQVNLILRSGVF